jgi:hypothetical protein
MKTVLSPGVNPFVQEMALPIFMVLILLVTGDACTAFSSVFPDWQEDKHGMNGMKSKMFSMDLLCMSRVFCLLCSLISRNYRRSLFNGAGNLSSGRFQVSGFR